MCTLAFSTSRFSFPIVFKSLVMSTLSKSLKSALPHEDSTARIEGEDDVLLVLVVSLGEVIDDSLICTSVSVLSWRLKHDQVEALTKILSSKMRVTGCCLDFKHTIVDGQERDIKGSSSKIVDDNLALVPSTVETVSDSGSGWLIHDSNDVQAGDCASILSGLSLIVVEIGRDCLHDDFGVSLACLKGYSEP